MGSSGSPLATRRSPPLDVRAALKEAMARLRAANVPSHTLAAELLLMHVLGRGRAWLYAHPEEPLAAEAREKYLALVARRIAGTPTQYLTGRQEFWGLEFAVEPGVLIPRPETEHVVEVALERIGPRTWEDELNRVPAGRGMRIADVGTGSGCLGVALARELPRAEIFATDISPRALEVARRNAARHSVGHRVHFVQCNLLDALFASPLRQAGASPLFDLIVSNPPYIGRREASDLPREVGGHEPGEALFGGDEGAELYAPLVAQAEALLGARGVVVLELGYNSLERVRPLFGAARWTRVGVTNDLAGIPRVIAAERV
jgi:release factor glutamine methyltransferase